jgi:hypothetical protein
MDDAIRFVLYFVEVGGLSRESAGTFGTQSRKICATGTTVVSEDPHGTRVKDEYELQASLAKMRAADVLPE